MIGGGGNDTIGVLLTTSTVTVFCGAGHDLIAANSLLSTAYGQSGDDTIVGGAGPDVLSGGDGDDFVVGVPAMTSCLAERAVIGSPARQATTTSGEAMEMTRSQVTSQRCH